MNADEMTSLIRDDAVLSAIRRVETGTSGEVRVFITNRAVSDAEKEAWTAFARLEMQNTAHRNAVLIFIAPASRRFALIGDEGLSRHCDAGYWEKLAAQLAAGFREADYTGAITRVITQLGETLAEHFPPRSGDGNELPDEIVRE